MLGRWSKKGRFELLEGTCQVGCSWVKKGLYIYREMPGSLMNVEKMKQSFIWCNVGTCGLYLDIRSCCCTEKNERIKLQAYQG